MPNQSLRHDELNFINLFHDLDGNGRVPRSRFFADLSRNAFVDVTPDEIATHFREFAWLEPRLFDNVIDVITTFKDNDYAVGVVTNGGRHAQSSKLQNSGLSEHLDAYIISEEFGHKKPENTIYEGISRRLKIDPTISWFVGDDPISDVVGPTQFGFNTVWLERHLSWPEEHQRCYKHRFTHISQLSDALFGNT